MDGLSFTTYLKLCLLPTTQGKTGELQRMHSSSSGYDFYKRMKLAAYEVAVGQTDPDEILAQLATIKRQAERDHNIQVATQFRDWWQEQAKSGAVPVANRPSGVFKRPAMPFNIRLKPELRYQVGSSDRVVYLWATAKPRLTKQVAATGLQILQEAFANTEYGHCEFSIFDLRQKRVLGVETISNASATNLNGDLAQIGAIWSQVA